MPAGVHWAEVDGPLLQLIAARPADASRQYHAALSMQGIHVKSIDAVRNRLWHLGLNHRWQRERYAAGQMPSLGREVDEGANGTPGEQASGSADTTVDLGDDAPDRSDPAYFQQLEAAALSWRRRHVPPDMYVVDLRHETRPVAFVHLSDPHIGLASVDYARLRGDIAAMARAEGCYPILAGDIWNNAKPGRKNRNQLFASIASDPRDQRDWASDIMAPIQHKIKGVVLGNHEAHDWAEAGLDSVREWCKDLELPYWGHGGVVKVLVGTQTYFAVIRHEFVGGARNGGKNVFERVQRPTEAAHLDWCYLGHIHTNVIQQENRASGEFHYLRGGTYNLYDEYADERFGAKVGDAGTPAVILYPHHHECLSYKGERLDLALRTLAWERSNEL